MSLSSPYTIISKIGKGGMAEVFKAIKKGPDGFEKTVALKKILPYFTDNPQFIRMLSTEAKIHSKLDHPNIVQLYDFFKDQDQYIISMEYVEGRNAKELITACKDKEIDLPWEASVYIIIETLKALQYAHNKKDANSPMNIIHRDISPHNILISYDGRVKLTDFGIANANDKIKEDKTKSGILKGKYRYLAPEQVTGEELGPQTDIFSTGVTLYELLTFVHPFALDQEFELFKAIVQGDYTPAQDIRPDIPVTLQDVLMMSMQPLNEDRFSDAKSFIDELVFFQPPEWLSFGADKLSKIMFSAFPSSERMEMPIETTKVMEPTSVEVQHDVSLIALKTSEPKYQKNNNRSWYWLIPSLISLMALTVWMYMSKDPTSPSSMPKPEEASIQVVQPPVTKDPQLKAAPKPTPEPKKDLSKPNKKAPAEQNKATERPHSTSLKKNQKALGLLTFSGAQNTEVFVNGKKIGVLPMRQYLLPPGTYLLLLKKGTQKSVRSIRVHAGETYHVDAP